MLKGLAPTRERARALIMAGQVFCGTNRVEKPGALHSGEDEFSVAGSASRYVSRGGDKLEGALIDFDVDVQGLTAVDVGASTGGFTDCLLQHGCSFVYAVDVGHGQFDWKLRNDDRVKTIERVNARYLSLKEIGTPVDLAVIDVSFISLTKVVPAVLSVLKPDGRVVALIKPQFEVGKGEVGKGGVVRDPLKQQGAVDAVLSFVRELDCEVKGVTPSRLLGPKGNREFFIYFFKKGVR